MKLIGLVFILVFVSIMAEAKESIVFYQEAKIEGKSNEGLFIDYYRHSAMSPLFIENVTKRSLTTRDSVSGEVLKFSRKGDQDGLKKFSAKKKWSDGGGDHKIVYTLMITDDLTKIVVKETYQSGKEKAQTTKNYIRGKVADCVLVKMNQICTGQYIAGPTTDMMYYPIRFPHYKAARVRSLVTTGEGNPAVVILDTGASGAKFPWAYSTFVLGDAFEVSNQSCLKGFCIGQRIKRRIPNKAAYVEGTVSSIADQVFILDDHRIVFDSGFSSGNNRLIAID